MYVPGSQISGANRRKGVEEDPILVPCSLLLEERERGRERERERKKESERERARGGNNILVIRSRLYMATT